jgi:hypothetical protein
MIAGSVEKDLGLVFQPAKRPGMNDPRPITLEFRPISVTLLGISSPARVAGFLGKWREPSALGRFHLFPRLPTFVHR